MTIKYISDLHLDCKDGSDLKKFLGLFNHKDIFIIPGDLYNNYEKTMVIMQLLENRKIKGYWVLGNHEFVHLTEPSNVDPKIRENKIMDDSMFSMKSDKYYDLYIKYIINKTKDFKYFKFLYTGKLDTLPGGWIVVGDTGWSSFMYENKKKIDSFKKYSWSHLGNWDWVMKQNTKFIKFVNNTIKNNNKVIVVSHHALYYPNKELIKETRFKNKEDDSLLFWYSYNHIQIPKNHKVIYIHGHTHIKTLNKNHYTNGVGKKECINNIEMKSICI